MKKAIIFGATALALAITAPQAMATKAKKIKIGFVTTLSGGPGVIGKDMRNSVRIALDHLGNKMGGIPVEVIFEDDQVKPEVGKQKTEKLLHKDKVDIVSGFIWSHVVLASRNSVVKAGKFLIISVSIGQYLIFKKFSIEIWCRGFFYFRNNIVIVCIKPLCHLHCRNITLSSCKPKVRICEREFI